MRIVHSRSGGVAGRRGRQGAKAHVGDMRQTVNVVCLEQRHIDNSILNDINNREECSQRCAILGGSGPVRYGNSWAGTAALDAPETTSIIIIIILININVMSEWTECINQLWIENGRCERWKICYEVEQHNRIHGYYKLIFSMYNRVSVIILHITICVGDFDYSDILCPSLLFLCSFTPVNNSIIVVLAD